jgi:hypothetical protein
MFEFATEAEGKSDEETAFRLGYGGRLGGEGFGPAFGGK